MLLTSLLKVYHFTLKDNSCIAIKLHVSCGYTARFSHFVTNALQLYATNAGRPAGCEKVRLSKTTSKKIDSLSICAFGK